MRRKEHWGKRGEGKKIEMSRGKKKSEDNRSKEKRASKR